ncbi:uncharacterized protein KZ484_016270 [Pholidichthys leucotaenia]
MNATGMKNLTTAGATPHTNMVTVAPDKPFTSHPTQLDTTVTQVVTTVVPTSSDSAVIAVVIVLILLTVAVLGFLLYRYLCHNKGDYRTTGEPAPGEVLDDDCRTQSTEDTKEYFI